MKMVKVGAAVAAGFAVMFAASSGAQTTLQFSKAEDAIQYRQSAFQVMRAYFGSLQPVVKGQVPYDKESVSKTVEILDVVARLPWAGFVPGSEGGDAKADVWSDAQGFAKAQNALIASLTPLTEAAQAGDLAKLRAAVVKTGASCKACHDSYRK